MKKLFILFVLGLPLLLMASDQIKTPLGRTGRFTDCCACVCSAGGSGPTRELGDYISYNNCKKRNFGKKCSFTRKRYDFRIGKYVRETIKGKYIGCHSQSHSNRTAKIKYQCQNRTKDKK